MNKFTFVQGQGLHSRRPVVAGRPNLTVFLGKHSQIFRAQISSKGNCLQEAKIPVEYSSAVVAPLPVRVLAAAVVATVVAVAAVVVAAAWKQWLW